MTCHKAKMNTRLIEQTLPAYSGGIRSDFHILVHSVSRLQRTVFDRSLKSLNVTRAQWWALKTLAIAGDKEPNQTDLAALMSTGKGSLGKLIARMESAGLLARSMDPVDQRAHHIRILDAGRALLKRTAIVEKELAEKISAGIPQKDLAIASKVLRDAKVNIHRKHIGRAKAKNPESLVKMVESVKGQTDPNWVGFLIHDVSRMRQSIVDRLLQPLGMTRSQWWVLSFLIQRDGMTQSALAKELELSRSALGTLILRLEENQLVIKLPDPEDSRRNRVLLTKAGASLVRSIRETTSQAEDFVLGGITEEDIHTTVDVMRSMKDNISKMLGDHAASSSHVDSSL